MSETGRSDLAGIDTAETESGNAPSLGAGSGVDAAGVRTDRVGSVASGPGVEPSGEGAQVAPAAPATAGAVGDWTGGPTIRVHLWLETEEGVFFGAGRAFLLERVERCGSLKKAAEELGMSYRAAWGKIRRTEKVLGFKLIEQSGSKREGLKLTNFGRLILRRFSQWFESVENEAVAKATELFPWPAKRFDPDTDRGGGRGGRGDTGR